MKNSLLQAIADWNSRSADTKTSPPSLFGLTNTDPQLLLGTQGIRTVRVCHCPGPVFYCQTCREETHLVVGWVEPVAVGHSFDLRMCLIGMRLIGMRYPYPALSKIKEEPPRDAIQEIKLVKLKLVGSWLLGSSLLLLFRGCNPDDPDIRLPIKRQNNSILPQTTNWLLFSHPLKHFLATTTAWDKNAPQSPKPSPHPQPSPLPLHFLEPSACPNMAICPPQGRWRDIFLACDMVAS